MKRRLVLIAVVTVAMFGIGCAGPGTLEKFSATYPEGEVLTVAVHDQKVPSWMLAKDKLAINYMVKGEITPKQLAAVETTEKLCRLYTGKAQPSDLVLVLSQGVLYGLAGYTGVGLGAHAFGSAVHPNEYAQYGASATGLSGVANGTISLGGKVYTFENCSREALDIMSQYGVRVLTKNPH